MGPMVDHTVDEFESVQIWWDDRSGSFARPKERNAARKDVCKTHAKPAATCPFGNYTMPIQLD